MALPEREVHVWLAWSEEAAAPERQAALEAILDEAERARRDRLRHPAQRQRFVLARGLLRVALSHYTGRPPRAWEIRPDARGRPRAVQPVDAASISFSLSHAEDVVACAFARHDVGVDVESALRVKDPLRIAGRFFAAAELRELRALEPAARRARFLELWTLKEAYAKASGLGLAVTLGAACFYTTGEGQVLARLDPKLGEDPLGWQFELRTPAPHVQLAVAVRRPGRADLRLRVCDVRAVGV